MPMQEVACVLETPENDLDAVIARPPGAMQPNHRPLKERQSLSWVPTMPPREVDKWCMATCDVPMGGESLAGRNAM